MISQGRFRLTRDMVPITILDGACIFVCPLPRNFELSIKYFKLNTDQEDKIFKTSLESIKLIINSRALSFAPEFHNILMGYHERSSKDQQKLLKHFQIERIGIDHRGVYSVQAGTDCSSGDIYLNSEKGPFIKFSETINQLAPLFSGYSAFYCHNMDFYWQALLTREFCVEYFNFLVQWLKNLAQNKEELESEKLLRKLGLPVSTKFSLLSEEAIEKTISYTYKEVPNGE